MEIAWLRRGCSKAAKACSPSLQGPCSEHAARLQAGRQGQYERQVHKWELPVVHKWGLPVVHKWELPVGGIGGVEPSQPRRWVGSPVPEKTQDWSRHLSGSVCLLTGGLGVSTDGSVPLPRLHTATITARAPYIRDSSGVIMGDGASCIDASSIQAQEPAPHSLHDSDG